MAAFWMLYNHNGCTRGDLRKKIKRQKRPRDIFGAIVLGKS
jgi:hypothetical protein